MKSLIKSLYIRLLSKELFPIRAEEIGERALEMMFAYRSIDESCPTQLNFSFRANQKAYQEEKAIYKFIVRHSAYGQ